MDVKLIYIDLDRHIPPAKVVHKNYQHGMYKFLLCTDRLAANFAAPLRARSTRQWRYVNCKRCLKKK
jgi:hypothetical protein